MAQASQRRRTSIGFRECDASAYILPDGSQERDMRPSLPLSWLVLNSAQGGPRSNLAQTRCRGPASRLLFDPSETIGHRPCPDRSLTRRSRTWHPGLLSRSTVCVVVPAGLSVRLHAQTAGAYRQPTVLPRLEVHRDHRRRQLYSCPGQPATTRPNHRPSPRGMRNRTPRPPGLAPYQLVGPSPIATAP